MDARTLEALEGSIRKWEAIVNGTGKDEGPHNCPLCELFHPGFSNNVSAQVACDGCPIKAKTRRPYCWDTPYGAYHEGDPDSLEAAQAELDFLRSLLPADSDGHEPALSHVQSTSSG